MARQVLEDFQIPAILIGANVGDARIGVFETVKLQVKESDVEQAMQILEDQEQPGETEDFEVMDELDEEDDDEDEPYEQEEE